MDRNVGKITGENVAVNVALRKESVDRNYLIWRTLFSIEVALRKESVDRNVRTMNVLSG